MRPLRWLTGIAPIVALIVALGVTSPAEATVLTVDTGKSLSLLPGESGVLQLSMSNDAGAITDNFSAWVLAVQLVPTVTTTGSIGFGTLTNPTVNPAIPRSGGDIEILNESTPLLAPINGQSTFQSLGIFNNVDSTTIAGSATYNLGNLQITSSGDAEGIWNVFAINRPAADGTISYWYDAAFNDIAYGNITIPTTGNTTSVLLGTVSVSAVPEPGSLTLAAAGAACLIGAALRRRGVRG